MENEEQVDEPQVVPEVQPEETAPVSESTEELHARLEKEAEARRQLTARAQKAEAEKRELEAKLKASKSSNTLDVEDYIGISASLEGLDQREKEKLAYEHKLSGKPLKEIRESEDFNLWQSAYRVKAEKERAALAPSSTQAESDRPVGLKDKLKNASIQEKEKILVDAGLWKPPQKFNRPGVDFEAR